MFGRMQRIANLPPKALNDSDGKNLCCIGTTPEGIGTNPVVHDLFWEMAWRTEAPDLGEWITQYAHRRYGKEDQKAMRAWTILLKTVYSCETHQGGPSQSVFCARPTLKEKVFRVDTSKLYYDPDEIVPACSLLLSGADDLSKIDTYQYDVVDLTRQVLANFGQQLLAEMRVSFKAKDKTKFKKSSQQFLELIEDQDKLLATRKEFLLGSWLKDAKDYGDTRSDKKLYEWNARTVITTWGDREGSETLHEYSNREWSGLLRDFYLPRWKLFIDDLNAQLDGIAAKKIDFYAWEEKWTKKNNSFSAKPSGDAVKTAKAMFDKYSPILNFVDVKIEKS